MKKTLIRAVALAGVLAAVLLLTGCAALKAATADELWNEIVEMFE